MSYFDNIKAPRYVDFSSTVARDGELSAYFEGASAHSLVATAITPKRFFVRGAHGTSAPPTEENHIKKAFHPGNPLLIASTPILTFTQITQSDPAGSSVVERENFPASTELEEAILSDALVRISSLQTPGQSRTNYEEATSNNFRNRKTPRKINKCDFDDIRAKKFVDFSSTVAREEASSFYFEGASTLNHRSAATVVTGPHPENELTAATPTEHFETGDRDANTNLEAANEVATPPSDPIVAASCGLSATMAKLRLQGTKKPDEHKKRELFPCRGSEGKRKMLIHENEKNAPKYQKMDFTTPHRRLNNLPQAENLRKTGKAPVHPKQQVNPFRPALLKTAGKAPLPEAAAVFRQNKVADRQLAKGVRRVPVEPPKENTQFKAKPPTVLYKNPFVPTLPEKRVTKTVPFRFRTDARIKERGQFQLRLQQHNLEKEAEKQRLADEKKRQAAIEIRELRKVQFRARPVPDWVYNSVPLPAIPRPPLTEPHSPAFLGRARSITMPQMKEL